ncbi:hypothetical protein Scep_000022 [Stephania cephalantha]|uniref:BZIP domain-containing protein n=1 Tax=Stephania cephalantha TaxID=152367 RepID=A0AAP0Q691_9MAGN
MADLVVGESLGRSDLNNLLLDDVDEDLFLSFESDGFADLFGDAAANNNDLLLLQPNINNNNEDPVVVLVSNNNNNNNNNNPSPDDDSTTTTNSGGTNSGGGGGCCSWGIREVEEMLLMEDDDKFEEDEADIQQIFSQILIHQQQVSDDQSDDQVKTDDDDHISKKRKRQIRNRDAALRSRERKKMYVKDLEMKSKFLEGECIRLQRLLHCCAAENHALHLQLHNSKATLPTPSKQESAVLLLESLLLGSLLWLVGIVCLLPLPGLLCPALEAAVPLLSMGEKDREIVDLVQQVRGAKNEKVGLGTLRLFFKCKQCKATRGRMKFVSFKHALLA